MDLFGCPETPQTLNQISTRLLILAKTKSELLWLQYTPVAISIQEMYDRLVWEIVPEKGNLLLYVIFFRNYGVPLVSKMLTSYLKI